MNTESRIHYPGMKRNNLTLDGSTSRALMIMSIPGLVFILAFRIAPLFGLTIAFKDLDLFGYSGPLSAVLFSPWAGFEHFRRLFSHPEFPSVVANTILISSYKLVFLFPLPLILALLLNEMKSPRYKRFLQSLMYMPHFLSWVVVFGLFYTILSSEGLVNSVIELFGGEPILFFLDKKLFRGLLVFTEGWKEAGWGTIVYLAAITTISPDLYEAATIDGAGRLQRMWHITVPGVLPVAAMLLILRLGHILDAGFQQVLVMYNPAVYDVADIIQTHVYRRGLGQLDYSLGSALGLLNSLISMALILSSNFMSRRLLGRSLW